MVQTLIGGSLEERVTRLQELLAVADPEDVRVYRERLDLSWIYHDTALEGVVYSPDELRMAMDTQAVSESSMIPMCDEIRQNKQAIEIVRDLADKKRSNISLDVLKKIYTSLAPEENEGKGPLKYRKEMPLHRLYFHEISPPDKIPARMRQLIQWINAPETRRSTHTVRLAAKAHHTFLYIYPFAKHNGKVARLLMNLILMRQGYPPAIIHATERQRYYDALKASADASAVVVTDALAASVESAVRYFEQVTGAAQSA